MFALKEGNHVRAEISPLHKANFQFQLCQPFESVCADSEDFDKAIQNLGGLQAKISETVDRRDMIVSNKNVKLVRFTSNIFEQRKQPIPKHAVYLPDIENPEGGSKVEPLAVLYSNTHGRIGNSSIMDAETENWPIAMKHRDEFDLVKLNYEASPLRLYRGNFLVEPADVNEALTGAVVKVFFVVRHYYLCNKIFDMFRTDIQQIKILKSGTSIACSGFKRRDAREELFNIVKTASSSAHAKSDESGRAEKRAKQVESKGASSGP
ncbi:hypothetical protein K503DRAFT_860535 [Rhizopogon vinicolor AM-OR11-026]|uniref:Uncharacterized protein n=1 Tax=Rhizopogon vinicolor AM-OR11-026 TaxID=1314800 RepID=A0A1B7MHD0_9AGAM|nr:hypothetical protein K503DRAFT_860535 [Rhizopogon vinicolor AM-OR11-026]